MTAQRGSDRPRVATTAIPGLLVVDLDLRTDHRGWFKENWQRAKMTGLGLPDFGPVQQNVSFNTRRGATRGIHAEPWDKLVSVATGRIFGAWVDLRAGDGFGEKVTLELGPDRAVYVPRGVGNAFQTLTDGTAYAYLVNDHWRPDSTGDYTFVNLADETLAVDWPVPLADADLSAADRGHPRLAEVTPVPPPRTLVLGAGGQLGRALLAAWPAAVGLDRDQLDLADPAAVAGLTLGPQDVVVNAAAHTAVDAAETEEGRRQAWAVNATGVGALVAAVRAARCTLVHVSTDYVFDGRRPVHPEDEPFSPLGAYGASKAAGDALVATLPRHYLLRTSWVVGQGRNFVTTMAGLADRGVSPTVVTDQVGRLTFTDELVRAVGHLLAVRAPYGTYNLSNGGDPMSWADVAREVYAARGRSPADVTGVTTEAYGAGRELAPRPAHSTLDLGKITRTGFAPRPARDRLREYLDALD